MGEKTRKFARRLGERDLFEVILREGVFYRPIEILQLLDDNDPKVLAIFLSVRERLEKECLEEGKGGEVERLLDVFNVACRNAGIIVEETVKKQQLGVIKLSKGKSLQKLASDFAEIEDDGTLKPEAEVEMTILKIARMTGDFAAIKSPKRRGKDHKIEIIPSRMRYIKRGTITMEICAKRDNFPELREGDEIFLVRDDERVPVKAKRAAEYDDISRLLDEEDVELKKWLPDMELSDVQTVAERMFRGAAFKGRKLVVIEFEKVD
jgi:ASC-1-like (ASCH) protein